MNKLRHLVFLFVLLSYQLSAQEDSVSMERRILDSLYIIEVQDKFEKDKVLHAEPLYIDLIRDLGARKGEKEWNVGYGVGSHKNYTSYEALVEYEWAPIDRLGLEVEIPLIINRTVQGVQKDSIPASRVESLKLALQWSFFVSEKRATTLALGYIHEFELSDFRNFGKPFIYGNIYNPFLVAAKRWGQNFHTLIYTGPAFLHTFRTGQVKVQFEWHTNVHYMIPGTRNFIGLEINKYLMGNDFDITLRPQMRLAIADNFLLGIVPSIPIERKEERLGMFLRVIWEPGHRVRHH
jgi:hypothetical protein